jgi:hypothetical protein
MLLVDRKSKGRGSTEALAERLGTHCLALLELLDRELDLLDIHLSTFTVKGKALPLARPCLIEVVAHDLFTVVSAQDDGARLAAHLPVDDLFAPIPQLSVVDVATLEGHVGVLGSTRALTEDDVISVLVLDDFRLRVQALYVAEGTLGDAFDLDFEVKVTNVVMVTPIWHVGLLRRNRVQP